MQSSDMLFTPLSTQNFANSLDWQAQERQQRLSRLRSPYQNDAVSYSSGAQDAQRRGPSKPLFNPASSNFTVRLGEVVSENDWHRLKKYELDPWVNTRSSPPHQYYTNTLTIDWPECADAASEHNGRKFLRHLFYDFSLHRDRYCPLSMFTRMTITVPERIQGPLPPDPKDGSRSNFPPADIIDLLHVARMDEIYWKGDFFYLIMGFSNMPSVSLTVLSVTGTTFCPEDALGVLEATPNLRELTLETIADEEEVEDGDIVLPMRSEVLHFRDLESLSITAKTPLKKIFANVQFDSLTSLYLSLDDAALKGVENFSIPWEGLTATLDCPMRRDLHDQLKEMCDKLVYKGR